MDLFTLQTKLDAVRVKIAKREEIIQKQKRTGSDDLRESMYKLSQLKKTEEKYMTQINNLKSVSQTINSLPAPFRKLKVELLDTFTKSAIKSKNAARKRMNELEAEREKVMDKISQFTWRTMETDPNYQKLRDKNHDLNKEIMSLIESKAGKLVKLTDEQLRSNTEKYVDKLIGDVWKRVIHITGDVTDAKNIHVTHGTHGFPVINGVVVGKRGVAKVESIDAGGYNIQIEHIRVLVKPL